MWEIIFSLWEIIFRTHFRKKFFKLTDPFVGEYFLFMGDYFSLNRNHFWKKFFTLTDPFVGEYFPLMVNYFLLKGNNFPLKGITFAHDRIPSMEEIFHFNGSVGGIKFSLKVIQFSIHKHYNVEFYPSIGINTINAIDSDKWIKFSD